jgi:PAS domain S-box-containing protein
VPEICSASSRGGSSENPFPSTSSRRTGACSGAGGPLQARLERRNSVPLDAVLRAVATRTEVRWVIQDVSEARQAEQRLWELNADLERRVLEQAGELAAVVDQLPIGVVFVDRDGMPKRANRRAHEILGDEVEAGTGAWADAFSRLRRDGNPLDRSEWPSTRALRGEVIEHDLSTVETRDGHQIVVDVSAVPIRDDAGAITSAVVTFDDVTERERLERADREFVVNAAHQIRTPITAIASAAAALEAGAKHDPEDRDRFLRHIEREVGRLARLGEALLTLARVERGEAVANLSIVPLAEVAWALGEEARATYGASVGVDCPPTLAALTNQPLVEQAIANLLENAVKYARHGRIDITAWRAGDWAVLEVRDSGPGMPPAVSERAFERFHRAGDDQTGFGLGLAIANNAVRACGGELELRSTPGVGTTAVITLPAATLVVQCRSGVSSWSTTRRRSSTRSRTRSGRRGSPSTRRRMACLRCRQLPTAGTT